MESRKQPTVALSTTKAEYIALASAVQELLYLKQLISDFNYNVKDAPTIYEDNQGAIALIKNPVYHSRTKHIDIKTHFVRESVLAHRISVEYLQTSDMVADCLTKPVSRAKMESCCSVLFGNV